ncbi:hypothetical protein, partial [Mesorhizobium sp.]|uniref:hypothetical protein n=1 Tax=Mesorhizobium sp. TaxID=1871066 RepID=UPI00257EF22E
HARETKEWDKLGIVPVGKNTGWHVRAQSLTKSDKAVAVPIGRKPLIVRLGLHPIDVETGEVAKANMDSHERRG